MVLPLDVWQKVFSNLALQDLRVCTLVSKLWNQAIESNNHTSHFLWYQLYQRDFNFLVENFDFNPETNYKSFYKSLVLSFRQKTLTPLIKKAEADLTKARAAGVPQSEVAAGYDKAIKNLETALKIQTQQKGDTTALTAIIPDLKQELLIPRILQEVSLYLPSEEEVAEFKQVVELYQDQDDPFSCWTDYIQAFEEEGLPSHLHFLAAALCEHQKDFITAACHYLELAQHHPHPLACLKKAATFVKKSSDPFAYPHFLEKLDRDKLVQLQRVANHNISSTSLPQWTHQARSNVSSSVQLPQTTLDAELDTWILHKDAIRMAFEECLDQLSRLSPQTQSPTCFICFNVEEPDIGKWLEHVLIPDLDRMGIKPLFCFRDLGPGKELNNFQGLIRSADQVILVCTPGLKKKCDERKKAPTGVAQEIRLAQERYNDPDKYETIFPLYLKGDRKSSCPSVFIEPILGTKFTYLQKSTEASVFSYYSSVFELLGGMRKVPREQSRRIKEEFLKKVSLVLKGAADVDQLQRWREGRALRHQQIKQSIQERVSVNTQMVNLPLPPQDFTGREKELKELHEKCSHGHRVAVTGLGGIGKTTLAIKYASDYKSYYQFIHFIPAGSYSSLIDGLLKLADDLHVSKSDKVEERLGWLKTTLERFEKEYLLIFDGIDQEKAFQEIEKYLPARGRCLLLTSRMPEQAKTWNCEVVKLDLFSYEEAVEYLLKTTGLKEKEEAEKLAELLGRLPLALKHAAGYIRSRGMTIGDYINAFKNYQVELFEDKYLTLSKEEMTILKTWKISIQAIEKYHKCPLAKEILEFFAFLGKAPIPDSLVKEWGKQVHPEIRDLDLKNTLRYLIDYSMISSSQDHSYEIHSLIQRVVRYQIFDEKKKKIFHQTVWSLLNKLWDFSPEDLSTWDLANVYLPHAEALFENKSLIKDLDSHLQAALTTKLGLGYSIFKNRQQTLEILKENLAIIEEWYQKEPNSQEARWALITCYEHIGIAYSRAGFHDKALEYKQKFQKLAIQQNASKAIARSYYLIGITLGELGRFKEAEDSLVKARDLQLKEGDIQFVALSNQALGGIFQKSGQPDKALNFFRAAVKVMFTIDDHQKNPHLMSIYINMGIALSDLNRLEEALSCQQQAIKIGESIYGQKSLNMVKVYEDLGKTLLNLKNPKDALNYYRQSLKILEDVDGENCSDIADCYEDIAQIEETKQKLHQARTIWLRPENKTKAGELAMKYNRIGLSILLNLGDPKIALQFFEEALFWFNRPENTEKQNDNLAIIYTNVSKAYEYLGDFDQLIIYIDKVLKICPDFFENKNHPRFVHSDASTEVRDKELNQ